jgi:hypothetical protein
MTIIEVTAPHHLNQHARSVRAAAERTVGELRDIINTKRDSLQVLRLMKFSEIGHHPLEDRSLNIIEQVNQTFTHLITLEAARWLFARHSPQLKGLRLNLGTAAGFDLESLNAGFIAAEAFAATHPRSNDKLRKDMRRLKERTDDTENRYVFFSCPNFQAGRQHELEHDEGIEVWSFPAESLLKATA